MNRLLNNKIVIRKVVIRKGSFTTKLSVKENNSGTYIFTILE